jgi:SAM-dependent methyltransferase
LVRTPFIRTINEWRIERKFRATLEASDWHFSIFREKMIIRETLDWKKNYLPISVRNMTILDVGAGEGETARFFLEKGAAKVICIEPSHESFKYLKRNAVSHPIVPINKFFEMSDLVTHPFDFLKMDIEGYEESLLETELSKPAVVEVHGLQLKDKFQKAGWRIEYQRLEDVKGYSCTTYAYWKC